MAFLFADRPALLKDLDNDEARVIEYERVRDRWFAFTVPFSIAHGCVVTLITYASTVQGTELANCGLAAFYACYTLSALTLATVFVDREGPRRAMLVGFGAYCILAFSYALFSLTNNAVTFAIVIIASAGGGVGGGLIWVSQSRHYAAMCKDAAGPAPNNFASSFAFWYIGTEGVVKLATASFLTVVDDLTVACTTLFILLVAAYGAMVLRPESCGFATDDEGDIVSTLKSVSLSSIGSVAKAHAEDPRIVPLSPPWLAFGFSSAAFTSWYAGVVSTYRPNALVGFAAAEVALVAGALAPLFGWLAARFGLRAPVIVGAASYAVLGIIMAVAGVEQNLTDNGSLWVYCFFIGAVRSFYENTSKMLVVEFLEDAPSLVNRAMAAMYFHNGSASTVTFLCLLIPANPYRGIGYAMVGFGLLIGAGFLRLRTLKDTETGYTLLA